MKLKNILIVVKDIPRVLSIYHKDAHDKIGEVYAYIMNYAEKNGYMKKPPELTSDRRVTIMIWLPVGHFYSGRK